MIYSRPSIEKGANRSRQQDIKARDGKIGSQCIGKEILQLDSTVQTFLNLPTNADYAILQVDADTIRYWTDSSIPTVAEGFMRDDKEIFDILNKLDLQKFKVIGSNLKGKLMIHYYKFK